MSGENSNSGKAYCINCGEAIELDAQYCPDCGASQNPSESEESKFSEPISHDGFTSWAIGFRPGKTGRNILVGIGYLIFYWVAIPLLTYKYIGENPDKSKYFAWTGGGFLIFASLVAIGQGTVWGFIVGGITLLLGLFFLPIVRQKIGIDRVPGINVVDSTKRSVIVGTGYAIGSTALVGSALPEPVEDSSNNANTADTDDSTGESNTPPAPAFAVRISYNSSWQGSISVTGAGSSQSESISGTGTRTIEITGDADIIAANAQKQDDSSSRLTIQILHNGDIVSEAGTTAAYGVAQTSRSF